MTAPCAMDMVELTSDGTGEGVGDPEFLATFWVIVMFTGDVTLLRTYC
jgi:hypothetical protein